MERIEAAGASAAEAMARELRLDAQLQAVDGALMTEANRGRLLGARVGGLDLAVLSAKFLANL